MFFPARDLPRALELELEVLLGLDAVLHEPPVRDAPVGADGPEVQALVRRVGPAHFPHLREENVYTTSYLGSWALGFLGSVRFGEEHQRASLHGRILDSIIIPTSRSSE